MRIGQMSAATGVSKDTLRYYEREGLLPPAPKAANGYRNYDNDALRRVRFIKRAQHVGFTLEEVRFLMALKTDSGACCQDVRTVAVQKRGEIEHKIMIMQAMSAALSDLINVCIHDERSVDECPILGALERSLAVSGAPAGETVPPR